MLHLRCRVVRVVHADHQPPIVEAEFVDAHGVRHVIHDKEPLFFADDVSLADLPLDGSVRCTRLEGNRISLGRPDGVESTTGAYEFDVSPSQLEES